MKEGLKSATIMFGEPCVMTTGTLWMLILFVDNLVSKC